MKNKRLNLTALKVKSFIPVENIDDIKGGFVCLESVDLNYDQCYTIDVGAGCNRDHSTGNGVGQTGWTSNFLGEETCSN